MVFSIKPYDICVANKVLNGKQLTLAWYVYDNKLSHVEKKVVDDILEIPKRDFGGFTIQ